MQEVDIYADSETFSNDSFQDDAETPPVVYQTPVADAVQTPVMTQEAGAKHQKGEALVVIKKDNHQDNYEEGSVSSEARSDSESDSDSDSDTGSDSTVDCLSRDPLFLVLSQYLANPRGNIVDILCKINKNLKRIADKLDKR